LILSIHCPLLLFLFKYVFILQILIYLFLQVFFLLNSKISLFFIINLFLLSKVYLNSTTIKIIIFNKNSVKYYFHLLQYFPHKNLVQILFFNLKMNLPISITLSLFPPTFSYSPIHFYYIFLFPNFTLLNIHLNSDKISLNSASLHSLSKIKPFLLPSHLFPSTIHLYSKPTSFLILLIINSLLSSNS
jgi:hypothetical protein